MKSPLIFRSILIFIICQHTHFLLFGQTEMGDFGARSKGLGNSNVTIADEWSMFNNVGGVSAVEHGTIFFGYDRFVGVEGFDRVAAGIAQPMKFGCIGASFSSFGDALYSENFASIAYGNQVGFVRLGIRASYYQVRIDEFGSAGALFFDFGGIVDLIPDLSFGAYISNFTLSRLNNVDQKELPVVMKIGFSYQPTDMLNINLDLVKDVDFDPSIKAGLEFFVIKNLCLRTGINTAPFRSFYGVGFAFNRFKVDYSISNHDFLGISHQAGISFTYSKKSEN